MKMIPFLIAQTSGAVDTAFASILAQYGALAFLLTIVGFMLFLTWRSSEDARTRRQVSEVERTKEDTKRDGVINDYASKYGELSQTVGTQGVALAKAEGKVDLLSNQLEAERERRQKENEELKTVIRTLSTSLDNHKEKVEKLELELNGKLEEIKALRLERDHLNIQLKDKDVRVMALEKDIEALQLSKRQMEEKVEEQSKQIGSLALQLSEMDKTIFDTPVRPMQAITETTVNMVNVTAEASIETKEDDKGKAA